METVRHFYLRFWRGLAIGVSLAIIAYLLYFHRLGSLLPGYSNPELATYIGAKNWHNIAANPIYAPYKTLVWLFTAAIHHRSLFITRAVAACFGLATGLLFYFAVRVWCSYRAAFLATVMFVTSAGLLHFARLGNGAVLQMGGLALLDLVLWYRSKPKLRTIIGYLIIVVSVLLWYVPGMIWFEALGAFLLLRTIRNQLRRTKTLHLVGIAVTFLVCLAPLACACVHNPRLLLEVAGLPQSFHILSHFGSNLGNTLLAITIHSQGNPILWVGHAPLLDTIEVIIGALGGLYMYRRDQIHRVFLFGSLAIGIILIAFGGGVTFACLVPILYVFIATGVDHLLGQWLTVFPRNPVARMSGIGIVCVMLVFSVLYQVRSYYVAWPNAPATRAVFDHPAP